VSASEADAVLTTRPENARFSDTATSCPTPRLGNSPAHRPNALLKAFGFALVLANAAALLPGRDAARTHTSQLLNAE
jgi:hypothetical protein